MKLKQNNPLVDLYNNLGEKYLDSWESLGKKTIDKYESELINHWAKQSLSGKRLPKILEIGFGPGRVSQHLLNYSADYYGIDISEKMIKAFKKKYGNKKNVKKIIVADVSKNNYFKNVQFDYIVAMRVLYDNKEWRQIIDELVVKLKTRGILIFNLHNFYSFMMFSNLISNTKCYLTNIKELKNILEKKGLKYYIQGYSRMPDIIYDLCNKPLLSKLLIFIEKFLDLIFGNTFLTRMFYVIVIKEESGS